MIQLKWDSAQMGLAEERKLELSSTDSVGASARVSALTDISQQLELKVHLPDLVLYLYYCYYHLLDSSGLSLNQHDASTF